MVTKDQEQKITYTTMSVEQAETFNRAYEEALARVLESLGKEYSGFIDARPQTVPSMFESRSPNDTRLVLGTFPELGMNAGAQAVRAARSAFPAWSHTPWQDRLAILRRAADNFRKRKYDISAWLTLEAGKARLEAMGEVEEAADLISTYCDQMEEHNGFVIELAQLTPNEVNHSVLRPYGVWVVIAPFNFPVALATGMIAGALVAGNTVVFKPSQDTPLCGVKVYECFADAGLPDGVLNLVTGKGNEIGEALSTNPDVDAIVFTGSKSVGMHLYREFGSNYPRPTICEMGGKNPVIVTKHADLEKAVEGTARAAFGYSGQKCSAASRVYVHEAVFEEFASRLADRTAEVSVGNPAASDVFMGPVIRRSAYEAFKKACETARGDGEIIAGGSVLTSGDLAYGYYCAPTVAKLPKEHDFFREELFVPLLAVTSVSSLDEALRLANDSEYGLTAGIFTEDEAEQRVFLDRMEAGVVYVNRKGGATTGAWPGVQSFGGWKASGSTGKSALGPWYVQQFMHEQSQTVVTD
jgi:1-pyrroline-5-carboxylate dehydrogenase